MAALASLAKIKADLLLIVGSGDEVFRANKFKSGILNYRPDTTTRFSITWLDRHLEKQREFLPVERNPLENTLTINYASSDR